MILAAFDSALLTLEHCDTVSECVGSVTDGTLLQAMLHIKHMLIQFLGIMKFCLV